METKTYIVALHKDIDYDSFWSDIESPTSGLPHIPDRAVSIVNSRDAFLRICEYALTDDEADRVRNDPRVAGVEIPVRDNPNVDIVRTYTQTGNFNKQAGYIASGGDEDYSVTNRINWGLALHTNVNAYGTSLTTTENYKYSLDGTGVDVVICDTGIQSDHPEFTYANGASRVTNVNWDSLIGISGYNTYSYSDTNGHGTNVCGIATGKTYGWAKGANIIPLTIVGLGLNPNDPLDIFGALIYWHQHKNNGHPTVVNMSWDLRLTEGYGPVNPVTGGVYRGTPWSNSGKTQTYYDSIGLITSNGNGFPAQDLTQAINYPYTSNVYNIALGEVIDAGIVVCQAAGNNKFKIDVPGGVDYDNYITSSTISGNIYYHRGASPKDPRAIVVGALDTTTSAFEPGKSQKVYFSCAGPRIDVYAAGTYIMSAGANTSPGTYFSTSFKSLVESGTSQASPQVAGIAALYLQAHPTATPAQVKNWIISHADTSAMYYKGTDSSYTDVLSTLGGSAGVATAPLGVARVKTGETTWANVANVRVKTAPTTWSNVRAIWTKVDSTTWKQTF